MQTKPLPIIDPHRLQLPQHLLTKRVREKDGLSYGFDSSLNTSIRDRNGVFIISGSYAPQNRAKVEAAALEELKRAEGRL